MKKKDLFNHEARFALFILILLKSCPTSFDLKREEPHKYNDYLHERENNPPKRYIICKFNGNHIVNLILFFGIIYFRFLM
jgi:hypothetical protein